MRFLRFKFTAAIHILSLGMHQRKVLTLLLGPVTDYGATIIHWLRHWAPSYQGFYSGEAERPSASYIVDVSQSRMWKVVYPVS